MSTTPASCRDEWHDTLEQVGYLCCHTCGTHHRHPETCLEDDHGADWSDSLADEPPSCLCGYNGTPEECERARS